MKLLTFARQLLFILLCTTMFNATAASIAESKIKLRLGINLLPDGSVKSAANEAADDITRVIGLLTHPTKTEVEIAKEINWPGTQALLLAPAEPPVLHNPLYRVNGRQIRLCYAVDGTSEWKLEDGQLSFRLRYVATTRNTAPVEEIQFYKKQGTQWNLFKQIRTGK